jgi:DNA-binding CsgD family transcriptional regulator/predicted transcriptional regulator
MGLENHASGRNDRASAGSGSGRSGELTRKGHRGVASRVGSPAPGTRVSAKKRDAAPCVNWQHALYALVLGLTCLVLVPLTSLWWIVLVVGALVPIALAALDRPGLGLERSDVAKDKERELLHALSELGEITPTSAAMRTSLTVDEATKMLDELAGKGHLERRTENGVMVYALRGRDHLTAPAEISAPSEPGSEDGGTPQRLEDPLSERELEVLDLIATGRTNSEVARQLFVSVGTVKSHTGNIYRKLGARNRSEAVSRARQSNLLR